MVDSWLCGVRYYDKDDKGVYEQRQEKHTCFLRCPI